MEPHSTRTTLKTIAELVGCSETTVSRVLNGKATQYRISDHTAHEIHRVAKENKFSPNNLARSLRTQRTLTLGLVIPDISNPFFSSIARHIEREARKLGYSIMLVDTEEETELEEQSVTLLHQRNIDGLIISPVGQSVAHLEALFEQHIPIVIIDRFFPNSKIPYVASDNYAGAKEAVSFLISQGHTRIACIQGLPYTAPNNDRVRGFIDAFREFNLTADMDLIVGDSFGEENGYLEMKLLLKRQDPPTAVFALSNLISLGILRAVKEENLSVPEDVSLIAFDEQPYLSYLSPPLTTVAQQNTEMGRMAIKMLFQQIQSTTKMQSQGIVLPTVLIKRHSVKSLA